MKIIYGSELSKEMKEAMANEVKTLDRKPCLAVLLVGDNPASVSYVKGKNNIDNVALCHRTGCHGAG